MSRFMLSVCTALLLFFQTLSAQALRDGKLFDQGGALHGFSSSAPEELSRMASYLGQWNVLIRTSTSDTSRHTAAGVASVTPMNRGHAIMERLHCSDFNGRGDELNTVSFLVFNEVTQIWNLGVASSHRENITLYDGPGEPPDLLLTNAIRRSGGAVVTRYRMQFAVLSPDSLLQTLEISDDGGESWIPHQEKTYSRREPDTSFMTGGEIYGSPAPDRPEEAGEFDFLIGEWTAQQEITLPGGQVARFPSHSSAVYLLNGHGILEYNWYDVDVNLPDAATSIVRLYNRAMRRWECMYLTNRFNSVLYFGGRREDDRIVLTLFETDSGEPTISYFVFHDMEKDRYQWHAETSSDRGRTFDTTWTIDTRRRTSAEPDSMENGGQD
jgi:hypothetical protein